MVPTNNKESNLLNFSGKELCSFLFKYVVLVDRMSW